MHMWKKTLNSALALGLVVGLAACPGPEDDWETDPATETPPATEPAPADPTWDDPAVTDPRVDDTPAVADTPRVNDDWDEDGTTDY
jgi:hypothetical protein